MISEEERLRERRRAGRLAEVLVADRGSACAFLYELIKNPDYENFIMNLLYVCGGRHIDHRLVVERLRSLAVDELDGPEELDSGE